MIVETHQLTKARNQATIKVKNKVIFSKSSNCGDGTMKLVAEYLINTNMGLGILPASSVNGLATELVIDFKNALDIIKKGFSNKNTPN